jgi:ABC-type nitrate/sulfonate/bicarbonate transport system ATPase subunit
MPALIPDTGGLRGRRASPVWQRGRFHLQMEAPSTGRSHSKFRPTQYSPPSPLFAFHSRVRVTLTHLTKRFGATTVLNAVSLSIASEELFFLLGPSGCGKTTLLRTLAGFYQPDQGEVRFGDRLMNGVPPHERNTGMVFQNYALWPHMTVAENVGYGLEVRKVTATRRRELIEEALAIVRMSDFGPRSPNQLSGGQQQRVALARALVIKPDLLLLDEPLSNLDARLRLELRDEIRRIHDETKITTIYVTHDQKEALSLADRMAVLRDGLSSRRVHRAKFTGIPPAGSWRISSVNRTGSRAKSSASNVDRCRSGPGRAIFSRKPRQP